MIERDKHHNERLVRFFLKKVYPGKLPSMNELISDNIIDGNYLAELAVSRISGIPLHEIGIGQDLVDGSDVKTSVAAPKDKSKRQYHLPVGNISAKIGSLRIIGYIPFSKSWKYFIIPNSEFSEISKLNIAISKGGEVTGKYAKYEVETWEEFCRK